MPLFYLLFGLYGLLLLATPFLVIALYVRNTKLRQQLNELTKQNAKQHTKLQRAIGELQSKLAATASPGAPTVDKPATPEASHPSVIPVHTILSARTDSPAGSGASASRSPISDQIASGAADSRHREKARTGPRTACNGHAADRSPTTDAAKTHSSIHGPAQARNHPPPQPTAISPACSCAQLHAPSDFTAKHTCAKANI